jgi:hypothetical protein
MTRQQIGIETYKPCKMQVQKRLKKVVGWVVDKFHNISEQDSGFTSTPTFTSPSKYQHFNGLHVTKVESDEKDG